MAYSKAAKRKGKKKAGGVAGLHRKFEREAKRVRVTDDNPTETVLAARARQMGDRARQMGDRAPSSLSAPMLGEQAGQAIHIATQDADEAYALWSIFCAYDRARVTYYRVVLNTSAHPTVSKMEFMPERLETHADDRPDLRTDDEKVASARNAWSDWEGKLARLPAWQRLNFEASARGTERLHDCGRITAAGRCLIVALRALREMDGR